MLGFEAVADGVEGHEHEWSPGYILGVWYKMTAKQCARRRAKRSNSMGLGKVGRGLGGVLDWLASILAEGVLLWRSVSGGIFRGGSFCRRRGWWRVEWRRLALAWRGRRAGRLGEERGGRGRGIDGACRSCMIRQDPVSFGAGAMGCQGTAGCAVRPRGFTWTGKWEMRERAAHNSGSRADLRTGEGFSGADESEVGGRGRVRGNWCPRQRELKTRIAGSRLGLAGAGLCD